MGVAKAFHVLLLPLALVLCALGLFTHDLLILYAAMALLFVVNVVYAIEDLSKRSIFLFFHLGLALFLISRPTIQLLRGGELTDLSIDFAGAEFSLVIIFASMLCLRLGASCAEWRQSNRDVVARDGQVQSTDISVRAIIDRSSAVPDPGSRRKDVRDNPILATLQIASAIIFVIGFIGLMWLGTLKLQAMSGFDYLHYYLVSVDQYTNIFVRTIATMEPFALWAFLATMPKKRIATVALSMHIITTIPMLIIGARTDFVLGVLFMFLYYVLRDNVDGKGSWIGHFERVLVAFCLPFGIVAMGLLRSSGEIVNFSLIDSLGTAIYQQGVSYEVLSKGFAAQDMIAAMGFKGYSFGALTDYILQGPFGTYILGNPDLGSSNSIALAVQGHSYAHTMSYFMHWNYLQGQGWGSSYLLELNQDFGFMGVGIFSFFFGMVLSYLPRLFTRSWLWGILTLAISSVLFHMPRGYAIEWISYIWTLQFWFTLVLIVGLAYLLRAKSLVGLVAGIRQRLEGTLSQTVSAIPSRMSTNMSLQPLRKVMNADQEYDNFGRSLGNHQASDSPHPADHAALRWLGSSTGIAQVRAGAFNHLYS